MAKVILGINYQVDFTSIPTNVLPSLDNTDDLGSASKRWKTFYIVNVGTTLIPLLNNTYDLGSSSYKWKTFYITNIGNDLIPNINNAFDIGSLTNMWKNFYIMGIGSNLIPTTNNSLDLGSSSYAWKTFYITSVGTNLIPATSTLDLGSLANPWRDLYLSGNTIYLGASGQLKYNTTSSKLQFSNNAGTNYDFLERHTMSDIYDNGGSGAINFNNGITQKTSINGAVSFSNAIAGRVYTLIFTAGTKTSISMPVTWAYGVAPVWSSGTDIVTLLYSGSYYYANASVGF